MLKKMMKSLLTILMVFGMIRPINVKAASITIVPDKTEVEVGQKVTYTVTISNGHGTLYVDGASADFDSQNSNGVRTFVRSYRYAGDYAFEASGTITDYTTGEKQELSEYVEIKVVEEGSLTTPDTGNDNDGNDTTDDDSVVDPDLSKEASLSSLIVKDSSGEKIDIKFESDKTDYKIDLTSKDTKVRIEAIAVDDSKAKIEGDLGLQMIETGENKFEIKVTAEDGKTTKTYTLIIKVEAVPVVSLTYQGKELGLMAEVGEITIPEGFTKTTATIDGQKVPIFENGKVTLVYAEDEARQADFYLYTKKDGIISTYQPLTIGTDDVYLIDVKEKDENRDQMTFKTITISQTPVNAWVFDDEELVDYALLYLMTDTGQIGYYVYDGKTQTIQAYPDSNPVTAKDFDKWLNGEEIDKPNYILYASIAGVAVVVIAVGLWMFMKGKKRNDDEEIVVSEPKKKVQPKQQPKVEKEEVVVEEQPVQGKYIETDLHKIKAAKQETDEWLSDDFYRTLIGDDDK